MGMLLYQFIQESEYVSPRRYFYGVFRVKRKKEEVFVGRHYKLKCVYIYSSVAHVVSYADVADLLFFHVRNAICQSLLLAQIYKHRWISNSGLRIHEGVAIYVVPSSY